MDIRVDSHPEPDDYFKFGIHHSIKRLILVPAIGFGIITVLYLALFGVADWPQELTVLYWAFFAFVVLLPLFNVGMIRLATNRQYRTGVHHDSEQLISDEGLYSHSELGEVRIPWSHIHKASESKSAVYLYISSAQALILSKRNFTDEQYAALHELCRKYIPPKRIKLKY